MVEACPTDRCAPARPTWGLAEADDGARLWWEWVPQAAPPAPGRAALVLLNGANCTTHYWPPLIRALGARIPILQLDWRGHGRSGREVEPATITIERLGADVHAVLDAAGCDAAVLVGHSLGVMVSLEAYRQRPDRVSALVPMFGTYGDAAASLTSSEALGSRLGEVFDLLGHALIPVQGPASRASQSRLGLWLAEALGANRALLPEGYILQLMEHIETMDPRAVFGCYRAALAYDAGPFLPEVRCPVLVFAGALDRMTPPDRARAMAAAIPDADLCVLPRGSHLGMLEEEAHVHSRLEAFLDLYGWLDRRAGEPAVAVAGGGKKR